MDEVESYYSPRHHKHKLGYGAFLSEIYPGQIHLYDFRDCSQLPSFHLNVMLYQLGYKAEQKVFQKGYSLGFFDDQTFYLAKSKKYGRKI
jgi:hypothetical protein